MSQPPLLLTVGEIARRLQTKVHRVEYIIRSRRIEATGWAGHARVFSEAAYRRIESELVRMEADRCHREHSDELEESKHGCL